MLGGGSTFCWTNHSRPDLALGIIQEDGIESDFQKSLPAKSSWDDNLPVGICCGESKASGFVTVGLTMQWEEGKPKW